MKWAFCFMMLMAIAFYAQSQGKQKAASPPKKQVTRNPATTKADTVFSLESTGNYPAKISLKNSSPQQLSISDPILRVFDARANGADISFSKSGVVGMPKHAYGFADGHLSLKNSGATTFGTQTGSGSVGTGTSLGTFGSAGPGLGVNGKSPYAGTVMWGNAYNMYIPVTDSITRKHKKQDR